jgi:hypothetical protein
VGAYSKNQQNKAAKGAANAISDANSQQYQQTREDLLPYMQVGQQAIPLLQQLYNGDYSGFESSPDYQFALQQGIGNLDKSAAARGGLFGGGHQRELSQFNQGLAGQYLGNYRGGLMQMLGVGQNAAAQTGQFGANAANNIGNAQAGYYQQVGDNNSQFASGLGSLFNDWLGSRQAPAAARQSSYAPENSGQYVGAGGQSTLGLQQPTFGNNYGNFGNWGWSR